MERKKQIHGVQGLLDNDSLRRVRRDEVWRYSVLDALALLSESAHPEREWSDLKRREPHLARLVDVLDYRLPDGTTAPIETVTAQGLLRLAQSVQSPRAERVRAWLAATGRQRLDESDNPELAILRARHEYDRKGHDRRWIDKRLRGMSARQELTSEWARRGATESDEYRALTNRLMESAFGMDVESYRRSKHLTGTTANLRDHMTDLELILTTLAESAATTLHRQHGSTTLDQLLDDVHQAGQIAAATRAAFATHTAPRRRRRPVATRPGQYDDREKRDAHRAAIRAPDGAARQRSESRP
jgi:hypothetical protein